jgi:hypothetical protein
MNYKVKAVSSTNGNKPFEQTIECEGYTHARREFESRASRDASFHSDLGKGSGEVTMYGDDEPIYSCKWEVINHSEVKESKVSTNS